MSFLNRLTIFPKLVLTFLVILIPLVSISLMMNLRSERVVRNEITSSMEAKLNFYLTALEYDFGPLVSLQQQYVQDNDIIQLAYSSVIMSNEQYTETIKNIQKKLLIFENMSSYVEDAFVYIPALDRKISATSFNRIPEDEAAALNQMIDPSESPFLVHRNRLWISLPYPNTPPVVGSGFTIGLQISGPSLRESLSRFLINGDGGVMLLGPNLEWYDTSGALPVATKQAKGLIESRLASGSVSGYELLKEEHSRYYVFYEKSARLNLTLAIFVDENSFMAPIRQIRVWLWWISLSALLFILLFSYRLYRIIHSPLNKLVVAFKNLEKGNMSFRLHYRSKDEFSYLFLQYNRTVARLEELIQEVYVHQYQVKVSELKQLQSQINPHFLYNCFFNLYRLAKLHETDKVIAFSRHLGDYFKYVTKNSDFVPLEQEVNYCRSYTAIQGIRFEDHIRVEFAEIPEGIRELPVPKLFLQPLLENCFQHGLEDMAEEGLIKVCFRELEDRVEISVEDNGTALNEDKLSQITDMLSYPERMSESEGLRNVQRRIRLNFGDEAGLFAIRGSMGGLQITAVIPYKQEGKGHVPADHR